MPDPFSPKPKPEGREPRTHLTEEIQTIAEYSSPSESSKVQVGIADISAKGVLFITSHEPIPLGAEVRATFQLPGLENTLPIQMVGKVVRTKHLPEGKCAAGIEFTEISEDGRRSIRSFCALRQLGEEL